MKEKVINTITKYNMIQKGDGVVAGVSGGPDSMGLLHVLHRLREDFELKLYAVHINHMLRGRESDEDEQYLREWCGKNGIPLFVERVNILEKAEKNRVSIEEAGREARYEVFRNAKNHMNAQKIAVAHNMNDNAETVLMHLFRGSGLDGLTGIDPVRNDIVRPLIEVERADIEEYCIENGINPRTDSSNLDTVYARNKVRLELLEYIRKEFNPNIITALGRTAGLLRQDSSFLKQAAGKVFDGCRVEGFMHSIALDINKFNENHRAIKSRVLRIAVENVRGSLKAMEEKHINDILELAETGRTGSELHLPGGLKAEKIYNLLKISLYENTKNGGNIKNNALEIRYLLKVPGKVYIDEWNAVIEARLLDIEVSSEIREIKTGKYRQIFDYEKINGGIYIRNRQKGDVINPSGMSGSRKLKDFFIDLKIPRGLRDNIPIVASGKEVIWVVGIRTSEKFRVTASAKKVLMLEYII